MKISYFVGPISETVPIEKPMMFRKYLRGIKGGTWKKKVEAVRNGKDDKKSAPYVTVSGVFTQRGGEYMEAHSGIIAIDIDKKDNPAIDIGLILSEILEGNFDSYHKSIGGKGYVLYAVVDPDKHEDAFDEISRWLLTEDLKVDKSGRDQSRARFVSYDPDLMEAEGRPRKWPTDAEPLPWDKEPVLKPVAESKPKGGLTVSSHISNSVAGELKALGDAAKALLSSPVLLMEIGERDVWRDRILFPLSQLAKDFPEIQDKVKGIFDMICKKAAGDTKNNDKEWASAIKSSRGDIGFASFLDYVGQVGGEPEPATDDELAQILADTIYDESRDYGEFKPLITKGTGCLLEAGGICSIAGGNKVGKTSLLKNMIIAVTRPDDYNPFALEGVAGLTVVHFDFELEGHRFQAMVRKIQDGESIPNYHAYSLRGKPVSKMIQLAEYVGEKIKPDVIVIDTVADLISSPNEEEPSGEVMRVLMDMADKGVAIMTTIHYNPGQDEKTRGHLGSNLARKATIQLQLSFDKETKATTIDQQYNRGAPIEPFKFVWSLEADEHVLTEGAVLKGKGLKQFEDLGLKSGSYTNKELMDIVMKKAGIKERGAQKRIKSYVTSGSLKHSTINGNYTITEGFE